MSGIDLTLNKVTYINGKPKIDEIRSPTDGTKPKSASKLHNDFLLYAIIGLAYRRKSL